MTQFSVFTVVDYGDVIELLEKYQANMDNRHFVFWLDFGGMKQELVHRSMQLLAREVIPHFRRRSLN